MRFFCLEDQIDILPRREIRTVLESLGHIVVCAKSKDEGVKLYPTLQPYDFLLLDHDMRGYYDSPDYPNSGTQFVKWLVKHPQVGDHDDPAVFLHSQNDMGRKAMKEILDEAGFRPVIEHSFDPGYIDVLRGIVAGVKRG